MLVGQSSTRNRPLPIPFDGAGGSLKQCPSCSSRIESALEVCPSCGHQFDESEPGPSPNQTVMGLPSISDFDESDASDVPAPEEGKGTLFGFPAVKDEDVEEDVEEDLDEESYDEFDETEATHLIPAEQLQKEFEADERRDALVDRPPEPIATSEGPGGTLAGVPAVGDDDLENDDRVHNAWGLHEESEPDSSTSVVPAAVLLSQESSNDEDGAGFSKTKVEDDGDNQHGTLMGMSLKDFESSSGQGDEEEVESSRSTQFAIPAVQPGDEVPSAFDQDPPPADTHDTQPEATETEESQPTGPGDDARGRVDSEEHDAPTAMWSPHAELEDSDDPRRKELLEKIRSSADTPRDGKRSTSQNAKPSAGVERPVGEQAGAVPPRPDATTPDARPPDAMGESAQDDTQPLDARTTQPSRPKLPDASELRARLKAKREALKTSRTAVGPDSIPAPNQSPNPKNFDDVDRLADDNRAKDEAQKKKPSGVLGVSYIRGKGDVAPERPAQRTKANVDKLRLDTGEVPEPTAEDLAAPDSLESDSAGHDEFDDDFAFADTSVASPELANQFRPDASDIDSGGSGLFEDPNVASASAASASDEFSTEPDLGRPGFDTEKEFEPGPGAPAQVANAPNTADVSDSQLPPTSEVKSPASNAGAPANVQEPSQPPASQFPQAPPQQPLQQSSNWSAPPPSATSQSGLHAAQKEERADRDARLFQTGFGVLAGLGLIAAGGWGAAIALELMVSIVFLFAAFCGLVSLTAAALPLPPRFKQAVWAMIGLVQVAVNIGLLFLEMSPAAPTVLAVCAGFGALMAVVFPLITSKLG